MSYEVAPGKLRVQQMPLYLRRTLVRRPLVLRKLEEPATTKCFILLIKSDLIKLGRRNIR